MKLNAEAQGTKELMLRLLHILIIGGIVNDSREIRLGEFNPALPLVVCWHGIKLQHPHGLCE